MNTKEAMIIEHDLREILADTKGATGTCNCWQCKRAMRIRAYVKNIRKQLSPPLVKHKGYLTTKAFKKRQERKKKSIK